MAEGIHGRQPLEQLRHVLDGGDITGEDHRRHHEGEDPEKRLLLGRTERRDEEPYPRQRQAVANHARHQQGGAAAKRHLIEEAGRQRDYGALAHRHQDAGYRLARHDPARGEGGHQQLIEGALFSLPCHRQGGDDEAADRGDDGHQGGQYVPAELDVGVVEVAHRQFGLRLALALPAGDHLIDVARRHLTPVGSASVDDELQPGLFAPGQSAGEILRNDEADQRLLPGDGICHPGLARHRHHCGEGGQVGEALDELPALRPSILVIDGERVAGHLQGGGEGEEGRLQQHRHDEQEAPLGIAHQGLQLFSDQPPESDQHVYSRVRRVLRAVRVSQKAASSSRQTALTSRMESTLPAW